MRLPRMTTRRWMIAVAVLAVLLGGCDTYAEADARAVNSTLIDWGTTASPYYLDACGWDQYTTGDNGSSTLTTDGHVYTTDSFIYTEDSGNTATDSMSSSGASDYSFASGSAYDRYINSDSGAITRSDTVTTSYDSVALADQHSVSAYNTSPLDPTNREGGKAVRSFKSRGFR